MGSVALTGVALAFFVRTSCGAVTSMVAVAVKLGGSLLEVVSVAVLTSGPLNPTGAVPLITNVTVAPGASVPRLSVTVSLLSRAGGVPSGPVVVTAVHMPATGAGSGSVRLTSKAV